MSKESIIGHDGGISIKRENVTWQTVLQAERAVNSEQGGWNHKSFWETGGLDRMTRAEGDAVSGHGFLSEWTQQSLVASASPLPRPSDFQLNLRKKAGISGIRGKVKVEYPNRLKIRSEPSQPEHRVNWRLYMAHREERTLTYELPLCAGTKGLLKADMVHFSPLNNLVEIIELKKGLKNGEADGRDSPLMALVEAICYGLQLLRCWTALQQELNNHLGVKPYKLEHLHLILAAPAFGKDCNPADNGSPDLSYAQAKRLRAIVERVAEAISTAENITQPQLSLSFGNVNDTEWNLEEILPELGRALPLGSILKPKST